MTPSPLTLLVLALAAYRTWRLAAQDTILTALRDRALGFRETGTRYLADRDRVETLGETRRKLLAEWLLCPWCSGLWVSAGGYGAWLLWPTGCLYGAVPLALSAAVGIIASALPD